MFKVMRRPKWIGALLLVFLIATVFVWLSAWQISRAEENAEVIDEDFETLIALTDVQSPQSAATDDAAGHRVSIEGSFQRDQPIFITERGFLPLSSLNPSEEEAAQSGQDGVWVVERFRAEVDTNFDAEGSPNISEGAELAVIVGWAATIEEAYAAWESFDPSDEQLELTGRFFPVEALDRTDQIRSVNFDDAGMILPTTNTQDAAGHAFLLHRVSMPAFVNLWDGDMSELRYNGYLISETAFAGLKPIESVAPEIEVQWNFLNIFYAVEWVFFAGFAGYIWYRMVRDEYEEEQLALNEETIE